ncbi:hypothetical protein DHEL01_v200376 [Diaporthe helianthi]|uniref:Uncharacterized protein n=1 Tax=Diaporthe helianthi TaxID=158607 RepID=A0A2P5IFE7_DIAHE|nr:hypothetical protein DHEL01_v200376 [Diaporthe helianthi]
MKINTAALALLATTAAAVPIITVGTSTTSVKTWTSRPTPTSTPVDFEVCMFPNKCGQQVDDEPTLATPEPAAPSATFEACVMPDGCSNKLNDKAVVSTQAGLPPQATETTLPHIPVPPPRTFNF